MHLLLSPIDNFTVDNFRWSLSRYFNLLIFTHNITIQYLQGLSRHKKSSLPNYLISQLVRKKKKINLNNNINDRRKGITFVLLLLLYPSFVIDK